MGIENATVILNGCGNITCADFLGNWNSIEFTVPDGVRCANEGKVNFMIFWWFNKKI